jgi:hypothetical protein
LGTEIPETGPKWTARDRIRGIGMGEMDEIEPDFRARISTSEIWFDASRMRKIV